MDLRDARVIVETAHHRITGTLQLPREGFRSRVTDYLNAVNGSFVPLTQVEIIPRDGTGTPETHDFLAVSVHHIVLASEAEG